MAPRAAQVLLGGRKRAALLSVRSRQAGARRAGGLRLLGCTVLPLCWVQCGGLSRLTFCPLRLSRMQVTWIAMQNGTSSAQTSAARIMLLAYGTMGVVLLCCYSANL